MSGTYSTGGGQKRKTKIFYSSNSDDEHVFQDVEIRKKKKKMKCLNINNESSSSSGIEVSSTKESSNAIILKLRKENEALKQRVEFLETENESLRTQLNDVKVKEDASSSQERKREHIKREGNVKASDFEPSFDFENSEYKQMIAKIQEIEENEQIYYHCPVMTCNSKNASIAMCRRHIRQNHFFVPFNCPLCGREQKNGNSWRVHVHRYHSGKKYVFNGELPKVGLQLKKKQIVLLDLKDEHRDRVHTHWIFEFMDNPKTGEPAPKLFSSGQCYLTDQPLTTRVKRAINKSKQRVTTSGAPPPPPDNNSDDDEEDDDDDDSHWGCGNINLFRASGFLPDLSIIQETGVFSIHDEKGLKTIFCPTVVKSYVRESLNSCRMVRNRDVIDYFDQSGHDFVRDKLKDFTARAQQQQQKWIDWAKINYIILVEEAINSPKLKATKITSIDVINYILDARQVGAQFLAENITNYLHNM